MISFHNVTKKYGTSIDVSRKNAMREILTPTRMWRSGPRPQETTALNELSFDLARGETLLVLGFKGSGKTTLARLLCGLTQPTSGKVVVAGTTRLVVSQKTGATPVMRLYEYTRLLCMMLGADSSGLPEVVETLLHDCHLTEWKDVRVHNAPGGAVKRLGFYASLLIEADVYVFDGLLTLRSESGELRERIDRRVQQILDTGTAVVLAKRVPQQVSPDQVLVLHRGRSILGGDPQLAIAAYDRLAERGVDAEETDIDDEIGRAADFLDSVSVDVSDESRGVTWDFDVSLEADQQLRDIAESEKLILAGPYLGGFDAELLLWIPFLRWALGAFGISPERVACLSRGGADAWYAGVGARYIDALDLSSEDAYHRRYRRRVAKGGLRQVGAESLDVLLYRRGITRLGIRREEVEWLHPSLFLRLAMAAWKGTVDRSFLTDKLSMEPLPVYRSGGDDGSDPPYEGSVTGQPYIAVWFGPTPYLLRTEAAQIVPQVLADLAAEAVLVDVMAGKVLEPPFEAVLPPPDSPPAEQGHVDDRRTLDKVTRIIAGAEVLVSAHGGLSYLGPLQRVPSVTVYSDPANHRPVPKGWNAVNFDLSRLLVERLTGSVPLALDAARISGRELLDAVRGQMT